MIKKESGVQEEFDIEKILTAISKAYKATNQDYAKDENILRTKVEVMHFDKYKTTKEIHDGVEDILMGTNHKAAKAYILYREEHAEEREIDKLLNYQKTYETSTSNAATLSNTDANANVSAKNVANLEGEVYKKKNRRMQRRRMVKKLTKMFGKEIANQYIIDLVNHLIYVHDEASSPAKKPYCMAGSLYPLMTEGVGNLDGITPSAPDDIPSFSGQISNATFLLSSQVKGAVAFAGYFVALNYYVIAEFGPKWYEKLDAVYTNDYALKKSTIRRAIIKGMKQFIWSVNQPAGNRSYNSPFTNVSWFDKYYFQAMYGDFYYPDGTQPEWQAVDKLQRLFMELMRHLRSIVPITFPVTTMSLLYDEKTKEFKDKDYEQLTANEWAKGGSFFCYMNSNPASLASCCRVLNEMDENTFSSTTGMNGEMTGSCNVITLNLNRAIQDSVRKFCKDDTADLETIYREQPEKREAIMDCIKHDLKEILARVYKYHIAYKTMLYDTEDRGMFASSNGNYIYIKKLYSTIGVIGYMEAAEFLGLTPGTNELYENFLVNVLGLISAENKANSIHDKKRPFKFNLEAIPGENLGVKLYNWDKADGYKVTEGRERYSCYFFNPWDDKNTTILDKIKLHGGEVAKAINGGQASHINLKDHLSAEQYKKLMHIAAKEGCNYFTFNVPITSCKDCKHVVNGPVKVCPKCGSTNVTYHTRVIGFLTSVDTWSEQMQREFKQRFFEDEPTVESEIQ